MILDLPVTLADRYEVSRFLGAGTFAETYHAHDRENGQDVAVKVLRPQFVSHRETLIRFEREARSTSEIVHPNVVRTLDYNMSGDNPFMVMEYVPGPDLKVLLQERGQFSVEDAVTFAVQILAGLDAIHQTGMIHRDVKPHNVLTDPEHGARLSDFGIARALDQTGLTRTGTALGTAAYMAPEQATGKPVTPAADLYAVGVMTFEMLTGRTPFSGEDPLEVLYRQVHETPPSVRSINPDVPEWVERIIMRAMAKEPTDRFSSAEAMIQALNTGSGSEDATLAMDPALIAAQQATAAMPARPVRSQPQRGQERVPPPVAPPPSRPVAAGDRFRWFRTPAIILAALLVVGLAVGALYGIGTWDGPTDDDPGVIVDDTVEDDPPADEAEPAAPVEEEEQPEDQEAPQDPEPDEQEPEVEEPVEEEEEEEPPVEEAPVEDPPPDDAEEPAPGENDQEENEQEEGAGNQGNPPPHAGGDQGEDQGGGQGQGQDQDNPGEGNPPDHAGGQQGAEQGQGNN